MRNPEDNFTQGGTENLALSARMLPEPGFFYVISQRDSPGEAAVRADDLSAGGGVHPKRIGSKAPPR
jgi:hypothetical protein